MAHDYKHHARSCFMSFYLRSDRGDQFRVHVRWRLGLWWWQSTTDSPHLVSSGAEKKQLHGVPISFLLVAAVSLQSLPQPGHWRGAWKYGDAGPGPLCFILQEAVNRYKTRLLRYVGFRRTSHLLEATLPRWQTPWTHSGYIKKYWWAHLVMFWGVISRGTIIPRYIYMIFVC